MFIMWLRRALKSWFFTAIMLGIKMYAICVIITVVVNFTVHLQEKTFQ